MKVGRVFTFKRTRLIRFQRLPSLLQNKKPASNRPGIWDVLADWVSNMHLGDPYRTAAHYFNRFLACVLHDRPHPVKTWVTIQEDLRRRVLNVGRENLLVRYKYVFPKYYLRHSYINEALYIAIFYKDLRFFVHYLRITFKDVNFFKHKFLIYFLRAVFNNLNMVTNQLAGTRGLFVKFRGKVSQAGNSRKKRFLVGCGQISTSQSATYEIEKFQIKTFTGAIGCTIILSSE